MVRGGGFKANYPLYNYINMYYTTLRNSLAFCGVPLRGPKNTFYETTRAPRNNTFQFEHLI